MEDRIVCHCMEVSYETIKKAIEDGAKTVDDIKEMTEASTGCGGCEDEIQEILDELLITLYEHECENHLIKGYFYKFNPISSLILHHLKLL